SRTGFAQQIAPDELGPKIRNQHLPIANLEHPCTISLINNNAARLIAKDSAEGCSKLAIGECLIAYLGLLSDLLCKAAKEGLGVVRSTSAEISLEVDRTTPAPPLPRRGITCSGRIRGYA